MTSGPPFFLYILQIDREREVGLGMRAVEEVLRTVWVPGNQSGIGGTDRNFGNVFVSLNYRHNRVRGVGSGAGGPADHKLQRCQLDRTTAVHPPTGQKLGFMAPEWNYLCLIKFRR